MARIPARWAAISVEPAPTNGSRTEVTPDTLERHHSMSGTGFWVGCTRVSFRDMSSWSIPDHRHRNIRTAFGIEVQASSASAQPTPFGVRLSQTSQHVARGIPG
jgi:hypothetical protein